MFLSSVRLILEQAPSIATFGLKHTGVTACLSKLVKYCSIIKYYEQVSHVAVKSIKAKAAKVLKSLTFI